MSTTNFADLLLSPILSYRQRCLSSDYVTILKLKFYKKVGFLLDFVDLKI